MTAPTTVTAGPAVTGQPAAGQRPARYRRVLGLLLDFGLAPAVYYSLSGFGLDTFRALVAATVVAALRVLHLAARTRRLDGIAAFMLGNYAVGLALSFVTGDAKLMLLKDPFLSGLTGLLFLGTAGYGRPAMFHLNKRTRPATEAGGWDARWAAEPAFRRPFRVTTLVWGLGLATEAVARAVLTFLLPTGLMVGLSQALELAVIALILAWTVWYRRRTRPIIRPGGTG